MVAEFSENIWPKLLKTTSKKRRQPQKKNKDDDLKKNDKQINLKSTSMYPIRTCHEFKVIEIVPLLPPD